MRACKCVPSSIFAYSSKRSSNYETLAVRKSCAEFRKTEEHRSSEFRRDPGHNMEQMFIQSENVIVIYLLEGTVQIEVDVFL